MIAVLNVLFWGVVGFYGLLLLIALLPRILFLLGWLLPLAGAVLFTLLLGQAGCYETRAQHCARVPADCLKALSRR